MTEEESHEINRRLLENTEEFDMQILPNCPADYNYSPLTTINLIQRIKRVFVDFLQAYQRQISKNMCFWIKYRPSRWMSFLPDNFIRPLMGFLKRKDSRRLLFTIAFLLSLIFVGVLPTLNFVWSNIFKVWLILLFSCFIFPLTYWVIAISTVYLRVIALALRRLLSVVLNNLIDQ